MEEVEGNVFMVMEYIDGIESKEKVTSDPMPMGGMGFQLSATDPEERYLFYSKREPNKGDIVLVDNLRFEKR